MIEGYYATNIQLFGGQNALPAAPLPQNSNKGFVIDFAQTLAAHADNPGWTAKPISFPGTAGASASLPCAVHNDLEATMVNQTQRRSIEKTLADLLAKYERLPTAKLARMIRQLHAELGERRRRS